MEFKIYRAKEDELIKGCLKRERGAQQQLFDLYSSKMYALCYRYVRHAMEAEDILVTAFTKVFDRIDQFKVKEVLKDGSGESWSTKPSPSCVKAAPCTWRPT